MTKLALATAVAALAAQAGCIIETSDRYDEPLAAASISARWSFRNMVDGAATACPSGFDTVQVVAQAIDVFGEPIDGPVVDLFDCGRRTGTSSELIPDLYLVLVEVRSSDLTRLYAQSLSQIIDVRDYDQKFSVDILNDGGYFQLSWDLVGAASNRPLGCSQIPGLDGITAISTNITDARFAYLDELVCEDHATVTSGLLQGTYTVELDVLAGDRSIGKAATLTNQVISGQNRVTDLGHIIIPIEGL